VVGKDLKELDSMKRSVEKKLRRAVDRVRGRGPAPTADAIESWLEERIATELGVATSEIRADIPFERYGLDSRIVAVIAGDLEDWLQRPLEATLLWDYPTIHEVSRHLAAGDRSQSAAVSNGS
jgi:polyketide synthase 12/myxalamid-type polyketide synthase MxaF